jgi:hypothetical protein
MLPGVSPWGLTSCPERGWCEGEEPCATVVYVRAENDGYVRYGLVGGP